MKGYVQLRRGLLEHFKVMSATEIKVYIGVLMLVNYKTAIVNITLAELADVVNLDKKIVLNSLHRLEAFGYVKYTPAKNQWHSNKIEIIKYNGNGKNTIPAPIATPTPIPIATPIAKVVTPNEINDLQNPNNIKNIKEDKRSKDTTTMQEVINLQTTWNNKMPWQVKTVTATRQKKLSQRLKDPIFKDNITAILDKILASDFLSGRKPSETHPNFKADFDWIIANDTNYVKVLEGKYDEKKRLERGI